MKKIVKRIFVFILCMSLLMGSIPVSAYAASAGQTSKGYVELNDGYLSVKVSVYTPNKYKIVLPESMEGYIIELPYNEILFGEDLIFYIIVDEGYRTDNIEIFLNGKLLDRKFYIIEDGKITVQIPADEVQNFFNDENHEINVEIVGIENGTEVVAEAETNNNWIIWIIIVIILAGAAAVLHNELSEAGCKFYFVTCLIYFL